MRFSYMYIIVVEYFQYCATQELHINNWFFLLFLTNFAGVLLHHLSAFIFIISLSPFVYSQNVYSYNCTCSLFLKVTWKFKYGSHKLQFVMANSRFNFFLSSSLHLIVASCIYFVQRIWLYMYGYSSVVLLQNACNW